MKHDIIRTNHSVPVGDNRFIHVRHILERPAAELDNGESDLLDFLTDDEKEIFELVWSEDEYKKIIDSNMLSLPNPNNRIKYPKF